MSDRETGQQKRPRPREPQWTAPASTAATTSASSETIGTIGTIAAENSWAGAQKTRGGHSYSHLAVFARDERSADLENPTFAPAATQTALEAHPQDREEEETGRGHRFSSIDIFPREDRPDRRDDNPAPGEIERANRLDGSALATTRTAIEPEVRPPEAKPNAKPKADAERTGADTIEEKAARAATPPATSALAARAPAQPDASRLTSSNGKAGASATPLADAGEARNGAAALTSSTTTEVEKPVVEPARDGQVVERSEVAAREEHVGAEKPEVGPIVADGKGEAGAAGAAAKGKQVDGAKKPEGSGEASGEAKGDGATGAGAGGRSVEAGQPALKGGEGEGERGGSAGVRARGGGGGGGGDGGGAPAAVGDESA